MASYWGSRQEGLQAGLASGTVSLLGLLAKIKSVVSVLISLISDTTPIGGQDINPIFVGWRRV